MPSQPPEPTRAPQREPGDRSGVAFSLCSLCKWRLSVDVSMLVQALGPHAPGEQRAWSGQEPLWKWSLPDGEQERPREPKRGLHRSQGNL
jgi:hypothetical protein